MPPIVAEMGDREGIRPKSLGESERFQVDGAMFLSLDTYRPAAALMPPQDLRIAVCASNSKVRKEERAERELWAILNLETWGNTLFVSTNLMIPPPPACIINIRFSRYGMKFRSQSILTGAQ
jgi:hypothetical protein